MDYLEDHNFAMSVNNRKIDSKLFSQQEKLGTNKSKKRDKC